MLENLPVLMIKKLVILPYQEVRIELNTDLSKKIVDLSENDFESKLLIICPNDVFDTSLSFKDLPNVGVLTKIKSKIELPNGNYRIILVGLNRVGATNYHNYVVDKDILEASIKKVSASTITEKNNLALTRKLKKLVSKYMEANPRTSNSIVNTINNINNLDMLVDIITNFMPFDQKKKIHYMNLTSTEKRAKDLIKDISL